MVRVDNVGGSGAPPYFSLILGDSTDDSTGHGRALLCHREE